MPTTGYGRNAAVRHYDSVFSSILVGNVCEVRRVADSREDLLLVRYTWRNVLLCLAVFAMTLVDSIKQWNTFSMGSNHSTPNRRLRRMWEGRVAMLGIYAQFTVYCLATKARLLHSSERTYFWISYSSSTRQR